MGDDHKNSWWNGKRIAVYEDGRLEPKTSGGMGEVPDHHRIELSPSSAAAHWIVDRLRRLPPLAWKTIVLLGALSAIAQGIGAMFPSGKFLFAAAPEEHSSQSEAGDKARPPEEEKLKDADAANGAVHAPSVAPTPPATPASFPARSVGPKQ